MQLIVEKYLKLEIDKMIDNDENINLLDNSVETNITDSSISDNTEILEPDNESSESNKQTNNGEASKDLIDFEKKEYEYVFSTEVNNNNSETSKSEDNIATNDTNAGSENSNVVKTNETSNNNKKTRKIIIGISISIVIILLLFLFVSTIFAIVTSYSSTIISGVSIKDIDVSGLNKEEALDKLNSAFSQKLSQEITLKHNEYETAVFPEQFEISFDLNKAVDVAYSKGRTRKYL